MPMPVPAWIKGDAMIKKFDFLSDPGHGWIKVPRALINSLGIAANISRYSYQRGEFAYLEEDRDLSVFFNAYRERFGIDPVMRERNAREKRSRVRGYDTYTIQG
jgi:hypothetical protein